MRYPPHPDPLPPAGRVIAYGAIVADFLLPSFPRKRESIPPPRLRQPWIPAFAGMTTGKSTICDGPALVGEGRGGGRAQGAISVCRSTPTPTLPHQGGGSLWLAIALAVLVAAFPLFGRVAAAQSVPQSRAQIAYSFAPVVKATAPAVVNIYSRRVVRTQVSPLFADPFFQQFFGRDFGFGVPQERVQSSLGSRVILGADGLIVTNNHVIKDSHQITVVLSDRREFPAKVVLSDERIDLALLRINAGGQKLPTLQLADSDQLEVGDLVLAIGDPFGVGQTVTSGIVSALARTQV